jgi:hypothetical protein
MTTLVAHRRGRGKSAQNLELIGAARSILAEIQPASVRAVCYRLFTAGLIPTMSKNATNRVGSQLTWAREQGIIPWAWIADDTRTIDRPATWDSPADLLEAATSQYRRDWWQQQPARVILCSEKSTVAGTVKPVTQRFGVGFLSLHGYSSATLVNDLADLSVEDARPLTLLYIGDWDPSGLDMSERDLPGRLARYGGLATVERIALTAADVADPRLPSFEAESKAKDARFAWFTARYGRRCWELDALSPVILRDRVEQRIRSMIDPEAWNRCQRVEQAERDTLHEIVGAWQGGRQ